MRLNDQLKLQRVRRLNEELGASNNSNEAHLRLLESVVNNANDGVLITETDSIERDGPRIQYVNPAFTRMTGYSPEEAIGRTPRILQGPLTNREALATIKSALREFRSVEVELVNYRKDGSTFWSEMSISPLPDGEGSFSHWISVQRDITERKRNQETAARARAVEIQNEQLAAEIEQRKEAEANLSYVAFHDSLTGVRNRAYFLERLDETLRSAKSRPAYLCALIYLDLDGFKSINDAFGHRVGDQVLVEVAQRLGHCCRPQDTLCRLGGDEFTLLIDDIESTDQAFLVAQRILDGMSVPLKVAGGGLVVLPSIGVCQVEAKYHHGEDVLRDADIAMYRAKQQGGSRFVAFNEEMQKNAMAAMQSKRSLTLAVERSEFILYYQPLVDTGTQRILAVEALVRWNHPDRGLLTPAEFIPLAEKTGLVLPLDSWVFREACRQLRSWRDALPGLQINLSVNASGRQLVDPAFLSNLLGVIDETGIGSRSLQIEIDENALLQDPKRMASLLGEIRQSGIRIAFDDAETGFSSLGYLERYPIDTLKMDKYFVHRILDGEKGQDLVRTIIGLAQGLGIQVSAEGVENLYQGDALRAFGCNSAQGFLYSPPVPVDRMTVMLGEDVLRVARQRN